MCERFAWAWNIQLGVPLIYFRIHIVSINELGFLFLAYFSQSGQLVQMAGKCCVCGHHQQLCHQNSIYIIRCALSYRMLNTMRRQYIQFTVWRRLPIMTATATCNGHCNSRIDTRRQKRKTKEMLKMQHLAASLLRYAHISKCELIV